MQQRLGLAVALVARPELVVLDEPTSALDPLGRVDVRDLVLSLKARGVAVLLNSHLIGEVERVCDRVVILDKGRVAASGTLARAARASTRCGCTSPACRPGSRPGWRATGTVTREGDWFTVALPDDDEATVPDLVRDLVGLGVRVHAVEPGRISLEERLLGILRHDPSRRWRSDRAHGADHRRAHAPRGLPPESAPVARRADDRPARAQRLGLLAAGCLRDRVRVRSPAARPG